MTAQRDFNYRGLVPRVCMIQQQNQYRYEAYIGRERNGHFLSVATCVQSFAADDWASDALESTLRQAQLRADLCLLEEPQWSRYQVHNSARTP